MYRRRREMCLLIEPSVSWRFSCDPTFDILTSKLDQFIFVYKRVEVLD